MPIPERDLPEPARLPWFDVLIDARIRHLGKRAQQRRTHDQLLELGTVHHGLGALLSAEGDADLALRVDRADHAHAAIGEFDGNRQAPCVEHRSVEARQADAQAHLPRHDFEQRVQWRSALPCQRDAGIFGRRPYPIVTTDRQHGIQPCCVLFRQIHL